MRGVGRTYNTWPLVVARKFLGHQAVDKGSRDHKGNQTPCTLSCSGTEGDGRPVHNQTTGRGALGGGDELRGKRCCEEEGICWEDPGGCHCMNGKDSK